MKGWLAFIGVEFIGLAACIGAVTAVEPNAVGAALIGLLFGVPTLLVANIARELTR